MARIKFLDVLEETKAHSPQTNIKEGYSESVHSTGKNFNTVNRDFSSFHDRLPRRERKDKIQNTESYENEDSLPRRRERSQEFSSHIRSRDGQGSLENTLYGRRNDISNNKTNSSTILGEDNKVLWTGALFVFFGGMLFLSGYWLGKTVTGRVKAEGIAVLNSAAKEYRREESNNTLNISNLPIISQPIVTTVDNTSKKSLKAVIPVEESHLKRNVKKVKSTPIVNKEYVIQVSAHSSMNSARLIEDKLREAGYLAYTSESLVGDAVYFRVRIRGFNNKSIAIETLSKVKNLNIGLDGYILSLD